MKITLFWGVTPYRLVIYKPMLLRNVLSPSSGQSTLMEAACSSETPVNACQTTCIITEMIAIFISSSIPQSKVGGLNQAPRTRRGEYLRPQERDNSYCPSRQYWVAVWSTCIALRSVQISFPFGSRCNGQSLLLFHCSWMLSMSLHLECRAQHRKNL